MSKRIAIYTFYESTGTARRYAITYLKAWLEVAFKVFVVVTGNLSDESRKVIESIGCEIFQRPNHGLDFGAWKAGLISIGASVLANFDELILCNCSCYGPNQGSFKFLFEEMNQRTQ